MAEKSFMINTNDVAKSITNIDEKRQRFQDECKRLFEEVTALTSVWSGSTAQAFNAEISQYSQTISELNKLLLNFAENVKSAIRTYEDVDRNLAEKAKSVKK